MLGIVLSSSSFPLFFSFPNSVENMQVDIRLVQSILRRIATLGFTIANSQDCGWNLIQ